MQEILYSAPSLFCQPSAQRGSVARFGSVSRLVPILLLALLVGFSSARTDLHEHVRIPKGF